MTTLERSSSRIRVTRCMPIVLVVASLSGASAPVADAVFDPKLAGPVDAKHADGRNGSVWVVNRDRGELTVFDAETGRVVTTMLVGAGAHDICISEQAGKAFITAETIDSVTTVDTRTLVTESIKSRSTAASHRAQPRRAHRLCEPGVAYQHGGSASVRGHRHRRQLGQFHHHKQQSVGAVTCAPPIGRRRDGLRGARSR